MATTELTGADGIIRRWRKQLRARRNASPLGETVFAAFEAAYAARDFVAALGVFEDALARNADEAWRYFLTRGSGQLADTIAHTGATERLAAELDHLLASHPRMNLIAANPRRAGSVARKRERNIDGGLPSLVLVSQGKSGSMTLSNIFHAGFGLQGVAYSLVSLRVIGSWARDYARGGACYVTHLAPTPENVATLKAAGITRMAVHVRDPRQALVSLIHHLDRYPDQLVRSRYNKAGARIDTEGRSIDERVHAASRVFDRTVQWIADWVKRAADIDIFFTTFEDMVADREAFIERYAAFYGGDRRYFSMEKALTLRAGVDYHIRKGRTDEWREVLSPALAADLSGRLPAGLKAKFGWAE